MSDRLRQGIAAALALLALIGVAAATVLFVGRYRERAARAAAKRLTVDVVNVGHGEATWVRTPGGQVILIGGGPPEAGARVVASLRAGGVQQIDLLILPYPYAEAIGGLPAVLAAFPVKAALEPGGPRVNQAQETVRALLDDQKVPVRTARAGDTLAMDGATVDILAPSEPPVTAAPTAANDSLVVRIGWGDTGFLFAGGIERAGEDALIADEGDRLRSDWLRVARFGTREASSPEFLRLVSPAIAVVSVGTPNSGDYPHPETMVRLQASGAKIYRTDEARSPDLVFTSDGTTISGP